MVVAYLRQLRAVLTGRRATEHCRQKRYLVGRLELEADAGRGQRIDRPALELIGGEQHRIAERGVDQVACSRADQEFVVGGDLADAQRNLVAEEILLVPGREQPRRRQRLDIARIRDAADEVRRRKPEGMTDLVERGVRGGALYAP